MRHNLFAGLVLFFVIFSGGVLDAAEYRDGYLLVRFTETDFTAQADQTRQAVVDAATGGEIERMYSLVPGLGVVQLPPDVSVCTARNAFQATIGVQYAEPDYIVYPQAMPNDPLFDQLWGLLNTGQTGGTPGADISAVPAWDINTGSEEIIVAVIDTGIDYTHPDLADNMWVNEAELNGTPGVDDDGNGFIDDIYGYDFYDNNGDPMDGGSHGTHVAGTIGAVGNNNLGITGVNWDVRLMAIRFLGPDGGSTAGAISSIEYATLMGAHLTNNSWGGGGFSQALYDTIAASGEAGLLFVAAAGNFNMDNDATPFYPASYDLPNIISVMATDHNDQRAGFSHYGRNSVHLGAPGVNILSTVPNEQYAAFQGTSMAAPHVAGAAALMLAENPDLTYSEIKQILMQTADPIAALSGLSVTGGRLNLYEAVSVAGQDVFPPEPNPAQWDIEPAATGLNHIVMRSVVATDPSGVEYEFQYKREIDEDWTSSGWLQNADEEAEHYSVTPWLYQGTEFEPGTSYTFRLRYRDRSENQNVGLWSEEISTTTSAVVDDLPPAPNPARWAAVPRRTGTNTSPRIFMEAQTHFDESGVEYRFVCIDTTDPLYEADPDQLSSNWQQTRTYIVSGISPIGPAGSPRYRYEFELQVRDQSDQQNPAEPSAAQRVIIGPPPRTLEVPYPYATIQEALDAAFDGETVVVKPGVYTGPDNRNLNFGGKAITLRSENPDNPSIVAATIIDAEGTQDAGADWESRRAFIFQSGERRNTVVNGFTIQNTYAVNNPTVDPLPDMDPNGLDAFGGAIYAINESSPTIANTIIRDSFVQGQDGRRGNDGEDGDDGGEGEPGIDGLPGEDGERGGDGGMGLGGAMYFGEGSHPLLRKVTIVNSRAIGGNAGPGGHGGRGGHGGDGENDTPGGAGAAGGRGGDSGFGGAAAGGAVYFAGTCEPDIVDSVFTDNQVLPGLGNSAGDGGHGGRGGDGVPGGNGGRGGDGGDGGFNGYHKEGQWFGALGGAVFAGPDCVIHISGSSFRGNMASDLVDSFPYDGGRGGDGGDGGEDGGVGGDGGDGGDGGNAGEGNTIGAGGRGGDGGAGEPGGAGGDGGDGNPGGGAGIGDPDGDPGGTQIPSRFNRSYGGAIALDGASELFCLDTTFQNNHADGDHGGALVAFYAGSTIDLEGCAFVGNHAGGSGGAIYIYDANSIDIRHSSFDRNEATGGGDGGAIFYQTDIFYYFDEPDNDEDNGENGDNNNNEPQEGIWTYSGPLSVTDCTFTDNRSGLPSQTTAVTGFGGAIAVSPSYIEHEEGYPVDEVLPVYPSVDVKRSVFTGNEAEYGGAITVGLTVLRVDDCRFEQNAAEYGGAMYWWESDTRIANSAFVGNQAIPVGTDSTNVAAVGGAIYANNSGAVLTNNTFFTNTAQYAGGAVYLLGPSYYVAYELGDWDVRQEFTNCLFVENEAGMTGGAVKAMNGAELVMQFSTLVDNLVTNMNGDGGAVSLGYDHFGGDWDEWDWLDASYVLLENSILWDNLAVFGPQAAVGDPLKAFNLPSTLELFHTNIEEGLEAVYLGEPFGNPWVFDAGGTIDADPQFIQARPIDPDDPTTRTFYLAQEAAGQLTTSPSVNSGWGFGVMLSNLLGFEATTRTDHEPDTGRADMGYHYDAALPVAEYDLTASVFVADYHPFGSLEVTWHEGSFTVGKEPSSVWLKQGTQALLTAMPNENYHVKRWIGTDDNTILDPENVVTMAGPRNAQVEFELAIPKRLLVPESYETIDAAVQAARCGDTIVLAMRVGEPYTIADPEGINFGDRQLTIRSEDPNDTYVIANTVIDLQGSRYNRKRAFTFESQDHRTVIEGITIRNGFWAGAIGLSGALDTGIWPPDPDQEPPLRALSGLDASGNGYGGAILVANGSSPIIRNVVFENNTVAGGIGGDGNDGFPQSTQGLSGDIDGQSGGHGGDGSGSGYGGAIAVIEDSSPTITNCIFRNNRATGGWGGIPGDGGFAVGNGRYSWGGHAGDGSGDGRGGAIYVETGSTPSISRNEFMDNYASLGEISPGGRARGGSAYSDPWDEENWPLERRHGSPGSLTSLGTVAGGAVFYGEGYQMQIDDPEADAVPDLKDSTFERNAAYVTGPSYFNFEQGIRDYTRGGAIYADPNVVLWVDSSDFIDNLGGAIYMSTGDDTELNISECLFEGNATYDPAGGTDGIVNLEQLHAAITGFEVLPQRAGAITIEPDVLKATHITGSRFAGNLSAGAGGAIQTRSHLTVEDSSFSANEAVLRGGAIFAYRTIADPNTHTIKVNLHSCEFTGNSTEEMGGALFSKNNILDIRDSQFVGNTAVSGGALMTVQSALTLDRGLFAANEATGIRRHHWTDFHEGRGGAMYLVDTDTVMVDSRILNNTAGGVHARGGGVAIIGALESIIEHHLVNCLIADNVSEGDGGGVSATVHTQPRFDNCTIAGNTAGNRGGGIYVDQTTHAHVENSIVYNNTPTDTDAKTGGSITTVAVLFNNPMFVAGPLGSYYLNQATSPAVDAGNITAFEAMLNTYTTSPSIDPVIYDTGIVDLGYHYEDPQTVEQFSLTAQVLDDNDTVRGSIDLSPLPVDGKYYHGRMVEMTVVEIPTDYVMIGWEGGTVNDGVLTTTNTVLMTRDKVITARVRQRETLYVGSSSKYTDIQSAVDAAQHGDNILIHPGTYKPPVGIDGTAYIGTLSTITLDGKALRISGMNPDDEEIVRNTVFEQYSFDLRNVTDQTVIEGITIRNAYGTLSPLGGMSLINSSPIIRNVIFSENRRTGGTFSKDQECPGALDGPNGASIFGGAVSVIESAPRFINCIFEDNQVQAGDGGDGIGGCDNHPAGGNGGWPGRAYGGAVYVGFSSSPVFENCTFTGNLAIGGIAGNGGDGIMLDDVEYPGGRGGAFMFPESIEDDPLSIWQRWAGWEEGDKYTFYDRYGRLGFVLDFGPVLQMFGKYDFELWADWFNWDRWDSWDAFFAADVPTDEYEEPWKYSGYGGAVYVGYDSEARFIGCTFESNQTQGGLSGIGGLSGRGRYPTPDRQLNIPNAGGAVYAAYDSRLIFEDSVFDNNLADRSLVDEPLHYEVSFGGAVAYEFGTTVEFINTDLQRNRATVGGAIYGFEADMTIADSNALNNEAYIGGAFYLEKGSAQITDTVIQGSRAKRPTLEITPPDDDDDDDDDVELPMIATIGPVGQGGGLFAADLDLDIRHSVFMGNEAEISGGGLMLAGTFANPVNVFNNLFVHNTAARDGGGASVTWETRAMFANCTFADNQVTGFGEDFLSSGGGLYLAYNSVVDVIDSIFWGNEAAEGAQITVGTGFVYDPRPSTLNIAYSNVQNFGSAAAVFRGQGCIVNPEVEIDGIVYAGGMFGENPLFEAPTLVNEEEVQFHYYLNQASPSIDAGSRTAAEVGLSNFTTSIFGGRDRGKVDQGYHYRLVFKAPCSFVDLELDGLINLADFAHFASAWLYDECGEDNQWCSGADLNFDSRVDADDLLIFVGCWLEEDTDPPFPSPSRWAIEPNAVPGTFTTIDMMIAQTSDAWWPDEYVQYYFECMEDQAFSSGWISEDFYVVSGLQPGDARTFRVRARDGERYDGSHNETDWSREVTVTPGENTRPTPDPAEWLEPPYVISSTAVRMEAQPYDGPALPSGVWVEYNFEYFIPAGTSPIQGGASSGWQTQPIYTNDGLVLGQTYFYRFRMRFNTPFGPLGAGAASEIAAVLVTEVDLEPPMPNPAEFLAASPFQTQTGGLWYHAMTAVLAEDESGVEYRFRGYLSATGALEYDSGWRNVDNVEGNFPNGEPQVPHQYWQRVGSKNMTRFWTVQYRDRSPNQNVGLESPRKSITNPNLP